MFLAEQRQRRIDRVARMIARLDQLGVRLDADAILRPAIDQPGTSIGRPAIARALVAAGYVSDTNEAFAQWLSRGRPGFVAREGAPIEQVISQIHGAGGVASLAHPGLLRRDEWIAGLASSGLDAVEAYHTRHDETLTDHYRSMAQRLELGVSGGSDYHAFKPSSPGALNRRPAESARASHQPRHRVRRQQLLVIQHLEAVEAPLQLAGLEQVIR